MKKIKSFSQFEELAKKYSHLYVKTQPINTFVWEHLPKDHKIVLNGFILSEDLFSFKDGQITFKDDLYVGDLIALLPEEEI